MFSRRADACAYLHKLLLPNRPDLARLVELRLDRRPAGDWSQVWTWEGVDRFEFEFDA